MTDWRWRPERTMGIWRHGAGWLRPFVAAAPYVTVGLLLLMLYMVGGTLTAEKGLLFDLPEGEAGEGAQTDLVALVMPLRRETVVFFDDSRYVLGDATSLRSFGEQLADRIAGRESMALLVLADRRVSGGEIMELAAVARQSGAARVLLAVKRTEAADQ